MLSKKISYVGCIRVLVIFCGALFLTAGGWGEERCSPPPTVCETPPPAPPLKGRGEALRLADRKSLSEASPLPFRGGAGGGVSRADSTLPGFVELIRLDPSIRIDIRYATADNFTQSKIYDCPRCFLRPEAARALVKAHQALQRQGLGLKLFDCYRPRPYQQRLWAKVPNPDYVTPPAKGSMHSRGAAVDLTLVDATGKELDMGTPYDYFGKEAHYDHTQLPTAVLTNRRLLRRTLEAAGFQGIRTEWWHFSYRKGNFPLSEVVWECK